MYQKVSTNLNFVDREKKTEQFWKENHIFEKSMEQRKQGETYTFYDGPPTANGKPHIGHVLTRVIKDMIPRYRTMKGYMVPRKAGWDTHGLPVELEVEKKLGLDGKEQIEEYGMEPFIKKCKESVWKYKGMWEDFSDFPAAGCSARQHKSIAGNRKSDFLGIYMSVKSGKFGCQHVGEDGRSQSGCIGIYKKEKRFVA